MYLMTPGMSLMGRKLPNGVSGPRCLKSAVFLFVPQSEYVIFTHLLLQPQ